MIIIAGLGNPGKKYENTRHNIGFKIVDEFKKKSNFSESWLSQKKAGALIAYNDELILAKPQSFMNLSGDVIHNLSNYYKVKTPDIIIIHDDMDLPIGKIKISIGKGSAGHKGVESIIKRLRTADFIRIRIGILPTKGKPKTPEKFVLQKFSKKEKEILNKAIKNALSAIGLIIKEGVEKTMNEYNK
ncbi:aminoacyl-tRNA hydrolase [Patescibacteria group bacterium]|nr:aminoacyl-tRNA hydrolase [Patescibacteria group bacterium]